MRRSLLCLVLLLAPRVLLAADELVLPAYERAGRTALPPDECQELSVERAGEGVLELRFFSEPLPIPAGPDPKTSGASLLLAANDLERASFALYHGTGIYPQSARLEAPIRWMRRGSELCVTSGSRPVFCGSTVGEILGTVQIAFGAGWQTSITGCAALSMPEQPLGPSIAALALFAVLAGLALRSSRRRRDVAGVVLLAAFLAVGVVAALAPWSLPSLASIEIGVAASGLLAALVLAEQRRPWRLRLWYAALALLVVLVLVRVPHPVATSVVTEAAVPPLWLDTANWHPRAPHQSLEFRGQPLAGVTAGSKMWLVLGGSVVFGDGVAAYQAFPAVAQDLLRANGDRRTLLNAGVQGWNIHNIDRLLADLGDAPPVTGIVLVSILNNATLPIAAPLGVGCERSLLRAQLCNASRNQLLFTWPKAILPKPHNPERYRSALRRLVERELALGRRLVLLDEASEIDAGPIRLWNADTYRAIAREIGAELGVPFHPVADALAPLPPEQRFLDGIHPTAAAHALLGRRLYEILRAP